MAQAMSNEDDLERLRELARQHTDGMIQDATAVKFIQAQISAIFRRLDHLEAENKALHAFVTNDEVWHRVSDSEPGVQVLRVPWPLFLDRWRTGWRP